MMRCKADDTVCTHLGTYQAGQMLSSLSTDEALTQVAQEVEAKTIQMVDEAK